MKTLSTLALLAAAVAGARAADPADPAVPEQQLYAMIFSLQWSDKLANAVMDLVLNENDSDLEPDLTSLQTFAKNCIKGDVSVVEPEMPEANPESLGYTQEELDNLDWATMTQDDINKMMKAFKKYISKIKLEAKLFFVSDAETTAKPECQSSKLVYNPLPIPGFENPFKVTMFQAVASGEDFATCVDQDAATGACTPVCRGDS